MGIIDIAGWLMVISAIGTFCFKNVLHLRLVCMFGCIVAGYYYYAQPVLMTQALLIQVVVFMINLYYVLDLLGVKEKLRSRNMLGRSSKNLL